MTVGVLGGLLFFVVCITFFGWWTTLYIYAGCTVLLLLIFAWDRIKYGKGK